MWNVNQFSIAWNFHQSDTYVVRLLLNPDLTNSVNSKKWGIILPT